jgi:hypothetical protein
MGKANCNHTAKPRAAEDLLLDDDVCWLPLEPVHRQWCDRIGNYGLATRDLNQALAQAGRLPCMIRSLSTGERRRLESTAWAGDRQANIQTTAGPPELSELKVLAGRVYPGTGPLAFGLVYRPYPGDTIFKRTWPGWAFYVSRVAFEAIWPPAGGTPVEGPLRPVDRAKVVLRALYPTKAQMPRSLKEATKAVVTKCEQRRWQPVSSDTVQRAAEQLGYRAPRKHQ